MSRVAVSWRAGVAMSPSSRLCLLVTTVTPAGLTATADVIPAAALSPPASTRQPAADWLAADSSPPMSVQLLSSAGKVRGCSRSRDTAACAPLRSLHIQPPATSQAETAACTQLGLASSPYTRGEPWLLFLHANCSQTMRMYLYEAENGQIWPEWTRTNGESGQHIRLVVPDKKRHRLFHTKGQV